MLRLLIWAVVVGDCALAQQTPLSATTMSGALKAQYERTRDMILRSADKVPDTQYGFRPTDEVRTFGQLVAHLADEQYLFCSAALEETSPGTNRIEKTMTTKPELVAALKAAFSYCDHAYTGMNDKAATQVVRLFGGMPRLAEKKKRRNVTAPRRWNWSTRCRRSGRSC